MKKLYCALTIFGIAILLCSNIYATTITLQPGSEGKDSSVYSQAPNATFGTDTLIYALNPTMYSLIQFDLSAIPANRIITGAIMQLNFATGNTSTLNAYKITSNWDEITVTWNSQPSIDASESSTATRYGKMSEFDITDFVNEWYTTPSINHGLEIRNMTVGVNEYFWTSDTNGALSPKLTITYDQETSPIPEPATILLLISGIATLFRKQSIW